jgi:hypothetical protein
MASISLPRRFIITNLQTSELHGVTSSTLGIFQHFVTSTFPPSRPLLLPPPPVSPSMTLHLAGGYCLTSACLSSHHPHAHNTTTYLSTTPSVIALMQHIVVILSSVSILLCRYTASNRTAATHIIMVTIAAPNRPLMTKNITQLFHKLAHLNQLQLLAPLT